VIKINHLLVLDKHLATVCIVPGKAILTLVLILADIRIGKLGHKLEKFLLDGCRLGLWSHLWKMEEMASINLGLWITKLLIFIENSSCSIMTLEASF
jgi:hypothetical protein